VIVVLAVLTAACLLTNKSSAARASAAAPANPSVAKAEDRSQSKPINLLQASQRQLLSDPFKACECDDVISLKNLLEHGLDIATRRESDGRDLFECAAYHDSVGVMKLLLAQGYALDVEKADKLIQDLAEAGKCAAIAALLDLGFGKDLRRWLADKAIELGSADLLQVLLDRQLIDLKWTEGEVLLQLACGGDNPALVDMLVEAGADRKEAYYRIDKKHVILAASEPSSIGKDGHFTWNFKDFAAYGESLAPKGLNLSGEIVKDDQGLYHVNLKVLAKYDEDSHDFLSMPKMSIKEGSSGIVRVLQDRSMPQGGSLEKGPSAQSQQQTGLVYEVQIKDGKATMKLLINTFLGEEQVSNASLSRLLQQEASTELTLPSPQ
jgi:hypothetical protein